MAQNKRRKKPAAQGYSSESLMVRSIAGIIFIALGVLSLLAVVGGVQGAAFLVIRQVMQGLGGVLCLGISVFFIWGGVLLAFSAYRSMPIRGFLLLLAFYLCVLALVNLLSKVGQQSLMEYAVQWNNTHIQPPRPNPDGFNSMMQAVYSICGVQGTFGGALGLLLGWVLWRYVGLTASIVITAILCLGCVAIFSQFDITGMIKAWRARTDEKLEEQEMRRQQAAYEMQQQQQMVQDGSIAKPAFLRRRKKERQLEQENLYQENPYYGESGFGMPLPPESQAGFPGYYPAPSGFSPVPGQPNGAAPAFAPTVELYDELIAPRSASKPAWKLGGEKKKKNVQGKGVGTLPQALQTEMTFTPSEVGNAAPQDRGMRKDLARMEEIRKRKAELAQNIFQDEEMTEEEWPQPVISFDAPAPSAPPASVSVDSQSAYKRPLKLPGVTAESQVLMTGKRLDVPNLKLPPKSAETAAEEETSEAIPYAYPTLDLLKMQQRQTKDTRAMDVENAARLESTLESFGIPAKVQRVTHGPAVTRFELGLTSSGVNVKRITSIADNIALEMAANGGVRIEIPIPGTTLFGIEVPNKEIESVSLAEVLVSEEMTAAKSPLAVALGRDIAGKAIICDLAKMPHLLIAGQTGSGKSVCINTIVNSLLFRSSPEQVRMIMIDPKVVELQCYNVVPHLLIPVVSDPHKAAGALAWAVAEMQDRYHKMKSKNVRELNAYNAKVGANEEKLPRIVIIIDELADLMLACKKEVEESIIRLAQLARAAGIHMIVATQRPTVDVITGLIKANIPSRIAFAVASSIDSRTILDANGAEKLLGRGDMFYFPTGASAPLRVQGCFLSDGEIERVVHYIEQSSEVEFDVNILEAMEAEEESLATQEDVGEEGMDDRLQEAIEMVISDGQASISMLQRRMKIGYARAGRMIDDMAARGVVSRSAGSKPREVLISAEEYTRMKESLLK